MRIHSEDSSTEFITGIRGVLALIVLNEHMLKMFFPLATNDETLIDNWFGVFELLSYPPLNFLANGAWAVSMFFVISGFVLCNSFLSKKKNGKNIFFDIQVRYLKLTIPILFSLALVYAFTQLRMLDVAGLLSFYSSDFIAPISDDFGFKRMVMQGLYDTIIEGSYENNLVLWSMMYEFFGSLIVFISIYIFSFFGEGLNSYAIKAMVYGSLVILFSNTLYLGFVLGMLICEAYNSDDCKKYLNRTFMYWSIPAGIAGMYLIGYMIRGDNGSIYSILPLNDPKSYEEYTFNTIGSSLLLLVALFSARISSVFSSRIMMQLGKISFSLYLTHFTVLLVVANGLYSIDFTGDYGLNSSVMCMLSVPAIFGVAIVFDKYIVTPSQKLSIQVPRFIQNSALTMITSKKVNRSYD